MWTQAKEKADPIAVAADYVEAAYEFADRTFGAVDLKVLRDFAAAAHKVAASVESGHHQLVDGYKQYDVPTDPVHAAYLGCILMRELRGCVHIDAVNEVGLSALEACYLQDPAFFTNPRLPRGRDARRDARERRQESTGRRVDVGVDGRVFQRAERRRVPAIGRRGHRDVRGPERARSHRLSVNARWFERGEIRRISRSARLRDRAGNASRRHRRRSRRVHRRRPLDGRVRRSATGWRDSRSRPRGARVGDSPRSRPRRRCGPARRGSSQCSPHVVLEVRRRRGGELHLESPSRARKVLLELFHRVGDGLGRFTLRSGQFVLGQMYVDDAFVGADDAPHADGGFHVRHERFHGPLLLERCHNDSWFSLRSQLVARGSRRDRRKGPMTRVFIGRVFSRAARN